MALFCCVEAAGFNTVLPAVHKQITRKAAQSQRFSNRALTAMLLAADKQDADETNLLTLRSNRNYRPAHHFDRNPGDTNQAAFSRAAEYVRQQESLACSEESPGSARRAMGRALHALQDFFAHTNFVDLTNDEQGACVKAIYDAKSKAPETLKLTGYDSKTGKSIKGDGYGHDAFAKDSPKENSESRSRLANGQTKFEAARDSAIEYSADFLKHVQSAMGEEKWKRIKKP
jgi:hypothetical protein